MEPFITSSLSVAQKIPTRDVSGLVTGVVIDSKVGPIEPTLITTPRQLLEMYTVNKSLSKGDHSSLINAFYLSRFTDLVIARATTSSVYPLIPIGGGSSSDSSILLPNEEIATAKEVIIPEVRSSPGDYKSLFLQVDNVLFYGKGQMNPFASGSGVEIDGTATAVVKATDDESLETNNLGSKEDYITVELPLPLTFYEELTGIITINEEVLDHVVKEFSGAGTAHKSYLNVSLNDDNSGLIVESSKDSYEGSSFFQPVPDIEDPLSVNVYNLSWNTPPVVQKDISAPYLIGYKNVGTVNTVKAWFSDVTTSIVDGVSYYYWNLNITDSLNGSQTYKVSDYPDAMDNQGNPIYYTWISETREDIVLIKSDNNSPVIGSTEPSSPNLGKSQYYIDSKSTNQKLVESAAYAAYKFEEYEKYRIQFYTDAGWYHPSINKAFESVAVAKYGLNCVGIDPSMKDVNMIVKYASRFNSFYSILHLNAGKDISIIGFQVPISPSCYYIERVANNSTRNALYAPTFSKVNGTISESNLYHEYNKTQRDILSKSKVNVLMYDRNDGISFINDNLLSDKSGSLIDEDQSIRIINDIRFDLESIMKNFYSLFNTAETRVAVEAAIESYFNTIIMPQSYTISGFNVVCSESNNTEVVIQNNTLKVEVFVKLNHSIKFIQILTNVVPTL